MVTANVIFERIINRFRSSNASQVFAEHSLSGSAALNSLNGTSYNAYGYITAPIAKNRFGTATATPADAKLDDATLELCTNIKACATSGDH